MEIALFILILLAAYHFYYQAVIFPIQVLEIRERLFILQDKLDQIKEHENLSGPIYTNMSNLLQASAALVEHRDLFDYLSYKASLKREDIKKVEGYEIIAAIEGSKNDPLKSIFGEYTKCLHDSFFVALWAWTIYLAPVAVLSVLRKFFLKSANSISFERSKKMVLYEYHLIA